MDRYDIEKWTVEQLASALKDRHKDNKVIAVPMFQRGKRWNQEQQKELIESLKKGFPVGTMLFYRKIIEGKETYILVDGLQRGDAIKKYMSDPMQFFCDIFSEANAADEFCERVLKILNAANTRNNCAVVRSIMTDFINSQGSFNNIQYFVPAKQIVNKLNGEQNENAADSVVSDLINAIALFFEERQKQFNEISQTTIPVIVYAGDESNLPEIFKRINSQGTDLNQYELYAASWPMQRNIRSENQDIIDIVINKYDSFIKDGFNVYNYDRESVRSNQFLNAFEYLSGLGKFLAKKYDILAFISKKEAADDAVSKLGFELVNACLNNSDKIGDLWKNINQINDINIFEKALYDAIDFVAKSIAPITSFKGNSRSAKKLFHSKFQILSMIAGTFKEMYNNNIYSRFSDSWNERKDILAQNLIRYYVYDILVDYWRAGGTKSVYNSKRYMSEIPPRAWRTALDGFFDKSMSRHEGMSGKNGIPNPHEEEYVILNCIYLTTFTAMDQLSIASFDVEHIAPKEQMKKLIAMCRGKGLPISCVANLCYLPEYDNRSKKDQNFYQDKKYLQKVDIAEIERKYSFTTSDDLEWMDMPYQGTEDFEYLRKEYTNFCVNRFAKIKKLFCESMGIDYRAMNAALEDEQTSLDLDDLSADTPPTNFYDICLSRIQDMIQAPLIKVKRNVYKTPDNKKSYSIHVSSSTQKSGKRERYWFEHKKDSITDCEEQYIVYGCQSANEVLCIPANIMQERISRMTFTQGNDGVILRWHVYFYRDVSGNMTQSLINPNEDVDLNQYKI